MAELNRRYHEMELEVRRLENEREELSAAYREAEAVSITFSELLLPVDNSLDYTIYRENVFSEVLVILWCQWLTPS